MTSTTSHLAPDRHLKSYIHHLHSDHLQSSSAHQSQHQASNNEGPFDVVSPQDEGLEDHELLSFRQSVTEEVQRPYEDRLQEIISNGRPTDPVQPNEPNGSLHHPSQLEDSEAFVYDGKEAENSIEEEDFFYDGKDVNFFDDQDQLDTDYATRLDAILESNHAIQLDDTRTTPPPVDQDLTNFSPHAPHNVDIKVTTVSGQGAQIILPADHSSPSPPPANGVSQSALLRSQSLTPSQSAAGSTTSSSFLISTKMRPPSAQFSRLRSIKGSAASSSSHLTPPRRSTSNSTLTSEPPDLTHHRLRSPLSPSSDLTSRNSSTTNLNNIDEASSSLITTSVIDELGKNQLRSGIFRWASLRRISKKIYPTAKRHSTSVSSPSSAANTLLGLPTVIAASGVIVIGTAKGWAMVFDYASNLKYVLGTDLIVKDAGAVSSLAISHDHTFVAVGHTMGYIYLYDLAKPKQPTRSVIPTTLRLVQAGRSEGHLIGHKIIHLGFIGLRHTAIVSADESGLAFYHHLGQVLGLASTDVIRILGKYPDAVPGHLIHNDLAFTDRRHARQVSEISAASSSNGQKSRKPTKIFGASPLPLGPSPHPTDQHSLVALLTPTKLIIIGLKPTPRTWWRCMRNITDTSQLNECGSLCWFPSSPIMDTMNRKNRGNLPSLTTDMGQSSNNKNAGGHGGMDPILAFSWGRLIRFVTVMSDDRSDGTPEDVVEEGFLNGLNRRLNNKVPNLRFVEGKSWTCGSAIESIQWLNWRIICVLTTTHFEIIDTQIWQRTGMDPIDLRSMVRLNVFRDHTQIQHPDSKLILTDLYKPDHMANGSLMGSFTAYKGKVFVLTTHDLRLGMVVSWADQILQLVEAGSLTEAINLTTTYWFGRADLETIGLPSEDIMRQELVKPKLKEIMLASLEYIFSDRRMQDATHFDPDGRGVDRTELFEGFVRSCAGACIAIGEPEFVFDHIFEHYQENGIENIFLEQIEPFILSSEISVLPVSVVQRLIDLREERGAFETIEQIIWHVDPFCLDINQVLAICSREQLYDALAYVYTQAMGDFVGPVVEFLQLIRTILHDRQQAFENGEDEDSSAVPHTDTLFRSNRDMEKSVPNAYKIYSYLRALLLGMSYPMNNLCEPSKAALARSSIYQFIFSGQSVRWPTSGGKLILTVEDGQQEPTYPYLRMLLSFDSEALLDTLDAVFEDPWLHDHVGRKRAIDRQSIVNLLLEVVSGGSDFSQTDRTFVHIFVARNLPKYPQFLSLSQSTLHHILVNLTSDGELGTKDDRQLAVEFLLSVYAPPNVGHGHADLLPLFEDAGFWRILRQVYTSQGNWGNVADVCLKDPDCDLGIFARLSDVFRAVDKMDDNEVRLRVDETVLDSIPRLADMSVSDTSALIDTFRPALHAAVIERLTGCKEKQFTYLETLLELRGTPEFEYKLAQAPAPYAHLECAIKLHYVALLCEFDASRVLQFLKKAASLLQGVAGISQVCRTHGIHDALIWQLDQEGNTRHAFEELVSVMKAHTQTLTQSLRSHSIQGNINRDSDLPTAHPLISAINQITNVAIDVCVKRSQCPRDRLTGEDCWFMLLSCLIQAIQSCASLLPNCANPPLRSRSQSLMSLHGPNANSKPESDDTDTWAVDRLRALLPTVLSSLISHTSFTNQISFSKLVRRLIEASGDARIGDSESRVHSTREFRSIVMTIMDTYRFEGSVLEVTSRLIDQDLFQHVADLATARQRGIRPDRSLCEFCRRPVWGPDSLATVGASERERVRQRVGAAGRDQVTEEAWRTEVIERLGLPRRAVVPVRKKSLKGKEVDVSDDFFSRPGEQAFESAEHHQDRFRVERHGSLPSSAARTLHPPRSFILAPPPRPSPSLIPSPSESTSAAYERLEEDLHRPSGLSAYGAGSPNLSQYTSSGEDATVDDRRRYSVVETGGRGRSENRQRLSPDDLSPHRPVTEQQTRITGMILRADGRVAHELCCMRMKGLVDGPEGWGFQ